MYCFSSVEEFTGLSSSRVIPLRGDRIFVLSAQLKFIYICAPFQLTAARQSLSLLKQDKEYLTRQVADLANRAAFAEEKIQQLNLQVEDAKRSREEMYDKYVSSR